MKGQSPVVHLTSGSYSIAHTLTVPANLDIIITGDGRGVTNLSWAGSAGAPVFRLQGPSKAVVRDLSISGGGTATGILIENADQQKAVVYTEHTETWASSQNNVYSDHLNYTKLDFANLDFGHSNGPAISAAGGNFGLSGTSRVAIFGGMSSIWSSFVTPNSAFYNLTEQGKILAQDLWYEGYSPRYVNLGSSNSGLFALSGTNVAPYVAAAGVNAISVTGFNGVATFLGNRLDLVATVLASGSNANMKMAFMGSSNITTNTRLVC